MQSGSVTVYISKVSNSNYDKICSSFIAFDVETTGLNSDDDVIIEAAAVRFEDGVPVSSYSTLINEGRSVPYAASQVNNITTRMLQKQGKDPATAYRELVQFFGDAMRGDTFLCAHNASFDMKFLSAALDRHGYTGTLRCVDTLGLSQELVNMSHHRLGDVARHFHIDNAAAHRATGDAETCGRILVSLLPLKKKRIDKELALKAKATSTKSASKTKTSSATLTDEEKTVAAIIINGLRHNNEVDALRLYKRNGFVEIVEDCPYIRFKIAKTMSYVLMPKAIAVTDAVIKECSSSEGADNVRLVFNDPKELLARDQLLVRIYRYHRNRRYDPEYIKSAKYYSRVQLYYLPEHEIARAVTENGGEYINRLETAAKIREAERAAGDQRNKVSYTPITTFDEPNKVSESDGSSTTSGKTSGSCWKILLWIFFFPIMFSVWILRTDKIEDDRVKVGLLIALWAIIIAGVTNPPSKSESASSQGNTVVTTEMSEDE